MREISSQNDCDLVCENGGTCAWEAGSTKVCVCKPGFTGQNCGSDVDECLTNPCSDGATCHDRVGYYFCECPRGRYGKKHTNYRILGAGGVWGIGSI